MTASPTLATSINLGTIQGEKITKTMPLIPLAAVGQLTAPVDTWRTTLASIIGASRQIELNGLATFSTVAARDLFIQSIDQLIVSPAVNSVAYNPQSISTTYAAAGIDPPPSAPISYYRVFIDTFDFWCQDGEPFTNLYWHLILVEGSGISGT